MPVRMSFKIQRVFFGLRNLYDFRRLQSGFLGTVIFMIIAAPPSNAIAQFPGVGNEAPYGEATTAADASVNDAGNSGIGGNVSNGASDVSSQSNYDDGGSSYGPSDSGVSTLNLKKEHHRKQLFVKKLRLEFAAIELFERKTGLPFSRGEVPRYLDELRSDLETMVAGAENGKITEGALKSIARDAYFIEARLNDHLDQLLEQAGQTVPRKPFFAIVPALPKASLISGAKIDALSLKFKLAEYSEKALQAMGAKRY